MRRIGLILTIVLGVSFCSFAQNVDTFRPRLKLSMLGGINAVSSRNWTVGFLDRVTPNFQIGLEYDFQPWIGIRLAGSGPLGVYPDINIKYTQPTTKFHYFQIAADVKMDLLRMFSDSNTHMVNPYFFAGILGYNRSETDKVKSHLGAGVRTGLGLGVNMGPLVRFILEGQLNLLGNDFNSIKDLHVFGADGDSNFAVLTGFLVTLGARK